MQRTDIVVVGAGPIGLELAANLKAADAPYLHLEAGVPGQSIVRYPLQTRYFSSPDRIAIAGVPLQTADQTKATREQYLAYLRGVVEQFDLPIRCGERVEALRREGQTWIVHSRDRRGEAIRTAARNVVLTIGDMHRPRQLRVPGEDAPFVDSWFVEPHRYFRQRLLIVGGRNSAAEAALRCHRVGARVAISYRREAFDPSIIKYWILPELEWLIRRGDIDFYPATEVEAIEPGRVRLRPAAAGKDKPAGEQLVEVDAVLKQIGFEMDGSLLDAAGVERVGPNGAPRLDLRTMQTNQPGLYVAGTAAAGTQNRFKLFIENCHPHVVRICRALLGEDPAHINPLGMSRLHETPEADLMMAES